MKAKIRVFIAGHKGMVGSCFKRFLEAKKNKYHVITAEKKKLDLTQQNSVNNFFRKHSPDIVIIAAAKVGGINANNSYPANFIYDNLMIQTNLIESSYKNNVSKLLFLGSSCIYPKKAKQPMKEESLLSGKLEMTNEAYAVAKISGLKMCEYYNKQFNTDFRAVMPTNLYGPGDNYHIENSHVIPGIINKLYRAKQNHSKTVTLWGTGKPLREFLYVEDMVRGCLKVISLSKKKYQKITKINSAFINLGSGQELSIKNLSKLIASIMNFKGSIIFDTTMPDGVKRKLLDISRSRKINFKTKFNLENGLKKTIKEYLKNHSQYKNK